MSNEVTPSLGELEIRALEALCKRFEEDPGHDEEDPGHDIDKEILATICGLEDAAQTSVLFDRLKAIGAIDYWENENCTRLDMRLGRHHGHRINALVFEIADHQKAILKNRVEPVDRVANAERWARSHPVWAYLFIALAVLTFLVTLANQSFELVKKLFGK